MVLIFLAGSCLATTWAYISVPPGWIFLAGLITFVLAAVYCAARHRALNSFTDSVEVLGAETISVLLLATWFYVSAPIELYAFALTIGSIFVVFYLLRRPIVAKLPLWIHIGALVLALGILPYSLAVAPAIGLLFADSIAIFAWKFLVVFQTQLRKFDMLFVTFCLILILNWISRVYIKNQASDSTDLIILVLVLLAVVSFALAYYLAHLMQTYGDAFLSVGTCIVCGMVLYRPVIEWVYASSAISAAWCGFVIRREIKDRADLTSPFLWITVVAMADNITTAALQNLVAFEQKLPPALVMMRLDALAFGMSAFCITVLSRIYNTSSTKKQ